MKQRFNLVLIPDDNVMSQSLIDFAQSKFGTRNKGYLLGQFDQASLPHITLCQFRADDEAHALKIGEACSAHLNHQHRIYLDEIYVRPKPDIDKDTYAVGFVVRNSRDLIVIQQEAHDLIESLGGQTLTKSGADYWPHITLAYIHGKDFKVMSGEIDEWVQNGKAAHLALGISDEAGQLKKILSEWPQAMAPHEYNP